MEAFGTTNQYTDDDVFRLAVTYLDSTLQGLWAAESGVTPHTWGALRKFLLQQLGDPADRLHVAWNKALHMRPGTEDNDYAYLQRWREQWSELGSEGHDKEKIILRMFFESYPHIIKQKVREQTTFPSNLADIVALITKLRPSLNLQSRGTKDNDSNSAATSNQPNNSSRVKKNKGSSRGQDKLGNHTVQKPDSAKKDNNNRCYSCGDPGHIKPNCPKEAAKRAEKEKK